MGDPRSWQVTADQMRAARKILQTLAEEFAVSLHEQSFLLHAVTLVALRDSLDRGETEWRGDPQERLRLRLEPDGRVDLAGAQTHPLALHGGVTAGEADAAYSLAEQLLDRHEMPEQERIGLYSALPCLGFAALQERCLRWRVPPPFAALGGRQGGRRKKGKRRRP